MPKKQSKSSAAGMAELYRAIVESTGDGLILIEPDAGSIVHANPAACVLYGYSPGELVGKSVSTLIHPDFAAAFDEHLGAVKVAGSFQSSSVHLDCQAKPIPVSMRGNGLLVGGRRHVLLGVRDVTAETKVFEELERRVEEHTRETERRRVVTEGLRDVLTVLYSKRALEESLVEIVRQACHLLDAQAGVILQLDEEEEIFRIRAAVGLPAEFAAKITVRLGQGAISRAVMTRAPVVVPDVADTELYRDLKQDTQLQPMLTGLASRFRSSLTAPLIVKDHVYGGIILYYLEPHGYREEEIQLAVAFAAQAAVAIENAQLHARSQDLAILEERQRLARELHDSVSQVLYGIALGAQAARSQLNAAPTLAAEPLDYIIDLANAGLAEMRALIFELRPDSLEKEGLVAALDKSAEALRVRHNIEVVTTFDGEPDLPMDVKHGLYRIALEALQNTIKHAHATRIELRLVNEDKGLNLSIRDNGHGFDSARYFPGHLGLESMRERAGQLGGALKIESAPMVGTLVCVRLLSQG